MPNPEVTFPARFASVSALAYAKPDGSAEVVTLDTPLPVAGAALAFSLPDGSSQPVSDVAPLPVAPAALPDGTAHIGNVFVDDVADGLLVSGTATAAAVVVASSLAGFGGGSFQVVNQGSGCTIVYEQSNDGVTWLTLPVIPVNGANTSPVTNSTNVGIFAFASSAAQVRARVSTYGSGTVSVVLVLKRRPLNVVGTSLASGSSSIGNVNVTGTVNTNVGFNDSTAPLVADATFTGTGRASASAQFCFFSATAFADAAGTLFMEQSLDNGATYQPVAIGALTAGTAQQVTVRLTGAYSAATLYRVRYVNGPAAQGLFRLSSAFSAR
ncbi:MULTISPECIES: hypothetical protein [unclassified Novosphingobium]|uniref:hypothetical protein n=1 Tax=unclassified Novosphingobium TaxID=2644732 RepID=UPI0025EC85B1|nr:MULTISPECIES: hypothetical protein [unclassified Novosphingobium]HQS69888.1 hypothetical protein [Novosphingobium sp.]